MKQKIAKSPMDRVKNPQGRPDWLLAKILEHSVNRSTDPVIKTSYKIVRDDVETLLKSVIGPRTKRGRQVKQFLEKGKGILREIHAA